jgi:hypothetical protein
MENDFRDWDNNVDRQRCTGDYGILDETLEGEPYSDDELRAKFTEGLGKLEKRGDFDTLMMYNDGFADGSQRTIVVWKALKAVKIHSGNLTGRQLMHLMEILAGEMKR